MCFGITKRQRKLTQDTAASFDKDIEIETTDGQVLTFASLDLEARLGVDDLMLLQAEITERKKQERLMSDE
jgi:hypothetical protein